MSKIEFFYDYQNSFIMDYSFKLDKKEMRETMSSEKSDQNIEININNNIITTKKHTFHIKKVKKRSKKIQCERKEEKISNKKKNSLIEKNSTNSDTAIRGSNYKNINYNIINQFNYIPSPGIFFEETFPENSLILSENTIIIDNWYSNYSSELKKKHKLIRRRKTYKDRNTKTLGLDNEHFKNLLKNFLLDGSVDLPIFLNQFDIFVVLTYCEENQSRFSKSNILETINKNFSFLKVRKVEKKYTTDNAFRNESLNCKIINHLLMFCNLVLSYLLKDTKIKIAIKDKKKKSVEFIKKIMDLTIEDLVRKHTNRYLSRNLNNLYTTLNIIQIQFFSLKLNEFLHFYFNSNIFKLLIYENSLFSSEQDTYFLDYSCNLIRQTEVILETNMIYK